MHNIELYTLYYTFLLNIYTKIKIFEFFFLKYDTRLKLTFNFQE